MGGWRDNLVWNAAAFVWGVAEGTLFFLVPDVIITFIGLRRGARAAAASSLYAAGGGAALGGAVMYLWSAAQPQAALDAVLAVPAISDAMAIGAQRDITVLGWFLAALLGPLTSTPYKVYAVFAPQFDVNLALFALASVIVRLPRFLIVGLGVTLLGRVLARWFSPRALLIVLAAAWLGFYAVFFALVPG